MDYFEADVVYVFRWMPIQHCPHDPRCHLDMLCIFVMTIRWPKGVLGQRGETYLKIKLNFTIYLAFEGQSSQFDAYVLRMRSG